METMIEGNNMAKLNKSRGKGTSEDAAYNGMDVVIVIVLVFGGSMRTADRGRERGKNCDKELTIYCKERDTGEGRSLACLYAALDRLSDQCDYALYDAAAQLGRAINTLTYTVNECRDDLMTYCATIQPGRGGAPVHRQERCEGQQAVQTGNERHGAEKIAFRLKVQGNGSIAANIRLNRQTQCERRKSILRRQWCG